MLDNIHEDLIKGTLLFLEEKSRLMSAEGNAIKTFNDGAYCLYLGFSKHNKFHLILCDNQIFRLNGFKLMTKTYIIQN